MRVGSVICLSIGLLGACLSFIILAGAALPYPDPTPELLAQQSSRVQFWSYCLLLHFVLLIVGSWGLWRSRRQH